MFGQSQRELDLYHPCGACTSCAPSGSRSSWCLDGRWLRASSGCPAPTGTAPARPRLPMPPLSSSRRRRRQSLGFLTAALCARELGQGGGGARWRRGSSGTQVSHDICSAGLVLDLVECRPTTTVLAHVRVAQTLFWTSPLSLTSARRNMHACTDSNTNQQSKGTKHPIYIDYPQCLVNLDALL